MYGLFPGFFDQVEEKNVPEHEEILSNVKMNYLSTSKHFPLTIVTSY